MPDPIIASVAGLLVGTVLVTIGRGVWLYVGLWAYEKSQKKD